MSLRQQSPAPASSPRPRALSGSLDHWEAGSSKRAHYVRNKVGQHTIPDYLLQRLTLVHDGEVVSGIGYERDPDRGDIFYDTQTYCGVKCRKTTGRGRGATLGETVGYGRLLTKNSFYSDLFSCTRSVAVFFTDLYSHFGFCCLAMGSDVYLNYPKDAPRLEVFVVTFIFCELVQLALAWDRSRLAWEHETHEDEGGSGFGRADIILSSSDPDIDQHRQTEVFECCLPIWQGIFCCVVVFARILWKCLGKLVQRPAPEGRAHRDGFQRLDWYNEWQMWLLLVFFEWVGVKRRVRDIVLMLHPFHGTMPWCALRVEDARCFLLGYEDKSMFRYEDIAGHEYSIPVHIASKVLLLFMKLRFAQLLRMPSFNLSMAFACIPTVVALYYQVIRYHILCRDRRLYKAYLTRTLEANPDDRTTRRLLNLHFGEARWTAQIASMLKTIRGGPPRMPPGADHPGAVYRIMDV